MSERHAFFADDEVTLPDVQPDRAWAEHLGMPRLIAELRSSRESYTKLMQRLAQTSRERDKLQRRVDHQRAELDRIASEAAQAPVDARL